MEAPADKDAVLSAPDPRPPHDVAKHPQPDAPSAPGESSSSRPRSSLACGGQGATCAHADDAALTDGRSPGVSTLGDAR